jgi:hypothetical protein
VAHLPSYSIKSTNTKDINKQGINYTHRIHCGELLENIIIIIWEEKIQLGGGL